MTKTEYVITDRIVYDLKTKDGESLGEGYRSREQAERVAGEVPPAKGLGRK